MIRFPPSQLASSSHSEALEACGKREFATVLLPQLLSGLVRQITKPNPNIATGTAGETFSANLSQFLRKVGIDAIGIERLSVPPHHPGIFRINLESFLLASPSHSITSMSSLAIIRLLLHPGCFVSFQARVQIGDSHGRDSRRSHCRRKRLATIFDAACRTELELFEPGVIRICSTTVGRHRGPAHSSGSPPPPPVRG
jgi:hypothetical protein